MAKELDMFFMDTIFCTFIGKNLKIEAKPTVSLIIKKMTVSNLYTWATLVGLCAGVALLTLEVWLIVHHSPVEMRVYRQILLQISALDFLPLIIAPLTQPVSNFINPTTHF